MRGTAIWRTTASSARSPCTPRPAAVVEAGLPSLSVISFV